ncbi:microtubule-associated protein tau-like isoform X1 [Electrophorus electricus]|uniref:microtubule-associated protein tau-like isoform X1 n=1 Tax=Electrophorus electricus TaxID=8005 RepID=UPI0015CFE8E2|nr:microtubule-associated protein tau-like isoform X1 [Electrophorus electricus]
MDFSLRDGAPKSVQDSLLKKDFLAGPEARSFTSKVGDTVDNMDGKREGFISGNQTGGQCPSGPEKQTCNPSLSGFSQPGMNVSADVTMGVAPFQSSKHPNLVEPQKASTLYAMEPPKQFQAPSKPSDRSPYNSLDNSAEVRGYPWPGEDTLSTELSHSPSKAEQSPSGPLGFQGLQDRHATSEGDTEYESREEVCGLLESLRSPEKTPVRSSSQGGSSLPSQGESWKSEIREWGGGRIQARKNKSRKKLPEEWSTLPNTSSPSPPPDSSPAMVKDMNISTPDMYEIEASSTISAEQDSASSLTPDTVLLKTTLHSVTPAAASQGNATSLSNIPEPSQSSPVVAVSSHTSPELTSVLAAPAHPTPNFQASIPDTTIFQNFQAVSGPSRPFTHNIVVGKNAADPVSPTSLTKHQEALLTKSPQLKVKEDQTAQEEKEKTDTPNVDNMNTFQKEDKPEKIEKTDIKETDILNKIQEAEKQNNKIKNNGKAEKEDRVDKSNKEKKNSSEKVDKAIKNEKNVKAGKGTIKHTSANGSKELINPEDKVKPNKQNSAGPNSQTPRGNSGATMSNSTSKKGSVPKTTPATGTKKPSGISAQAALTSQKEAPAQRKPPVPRANGAPAPGTGAPKRSYRTKNSTKPAYISSLKTSQRRTPTSSSTNAASTPATPARNGTPTPRHSRITKPPVPKQVPLPRKPPVPRPPRNTRLGSTPMPDLKNISSKIGSTDNMKYQPGGGKVQIVHKKLDFSHVTSRCGSKDNIKHTPGGGNVQILNKKVDVSKVTSKCGSKDNIKHKPSGGDVKTVSDEMNSKDKPGSPDSVGDGQGDHMKTAEDKQMHERSPPVAAVTTTFHGANHGSKENGLKEGPSPPLSIHYGGVGLWNSEGLDKCISGTN